MKNKAGKTAPLVTVLIVFAILAILVIGYSVVKNAALDKPEKGAGGSTTDCNIAPSLSFSVFNELQKGSQVATVETVILNGVLQTPGAVPTSFQYGDKVSVLYNASNYIDVEGPEHTMTCGVNTLNQGIYASDDPAVRIFNTDGNRMTDQELDNCVISPGTNQTSSASSISMKLEIQSAPLQSSGDLIVVVEVDNSTEVGFSDITLSGTGVKNAEVPSFYTVNATNSVTRAFWVPATVNGVLNTYYINLAPKTGQTIGASGSAGTEVYVTLYSEQDFYDTDGTFKTGIENADGTTKYEDTERYGLCIIG